MSKSTYIEAQRIALASLLITFAILSSRILAQTSTDDTSVFDVVSVKQSKATDDRSHIYNPSTNGSFRTVNVSFKDLVEFVFGLQEVQIVGIPSNIASATFDIDARVNSETDARLAKLDKVARDKIKKVMTQALLTERFQFKSHNERRIVPVYALVPSKGGPLLAASKVTGLKIGGTASSITGSGINMEQLASQLAIRVGRPVIDHTGIPGQFDVVISWDPQMNVSNTDGVSSSSLPSSVFSAVQAQLGLKLESTREEVEIMVVDRVSMPTPN